MFGLFFSTLCSCGINTKEWPTIQINFSKDEISSSVIYYERKKDNYIDSVEDTLILGNKEQIEDIICTISNCKYNEKIETKLDDNNYVSKLFVTFNFEDNHNGNFVVKFFEYGINDCKVLFDNGEIHFVTADISYIYEYFKGEG